MAGETFLTQALLVASATSSYETRITQALIVGSVTLSYKAQLTQAALVVSVWTAYKTNITQMALVAWVITCDSTSYVPPALTGLITLMTTPGATGQQWIDLAWSAVPGMTYTLQRGIMSGVYTVTLLTGSSATSYHDASVSFNVQYYYLVTATNVCSDSTASNQATATPGCDLPANPLRLHATANNVSGTIDLVWNPS